MKGFILGLAKKTNLLFRELSVDFPRKAGRALREPGIVGKYLKALLGHRYASASVETLPAGEGELVLYGDFDELHDSWPGRTLSFAQIGAAAERNRGKDFRVCVGITRYNFARLVEMARAAHKLVGGSAVIPAVTMELFPVKKLTTSFERYLAAVKEPCDHRVTFRIVDPALIDILNNVAFHAGVNPGREKELLRLLGVVTEQVFIGPQTIVFDPFHRCNMKCQHCWVHTPGVRHPQEFLDRKFDFEIFKRVIDDASELKTDGIILQGDGEPLMYDKFMPMLRYARSRELGILFFTNGILLDADMAKEIIALGVNEIYCSYPAGTPETYAKVSVIQPAAAFERVRDNLKTLMELRNAAGKRLPRLIVSHVISNLNYMELVEMAKVDSVIKPDAVRFYLIRLDEMNRFLQLSPAQVEAIKAQVPEVERILRQHNIEFVDNFGFQLENYDEKTGAWSKDFFLNHGCTIGWYFNLIPARYDMSFCCHLRTVGYVDKRSFKEIWFSREYWRWRRQAKRLKDNRGARFANGQVLFDEHCDHCDNHQTMLHVLADLEKYGLKEYF